MRDYAAALDGVKEKLGNIGAARTRPGSIDALCVSYYRSPEFRGLKPSTQTTYRGIVERFRAEHGDKPVRLLQRGHIKAIIGAMSATPEAANNLLRMIRMLLGFGVDMDIIPLNAALGIRGFKHRGTGFHSWTEEEISRFNEHHPIGTKPRFQRFVFAPAAPRRCRSHGLATRSRRVDRRSAGKNRRAPKYPAASGFGLVLGRLVAEQPYFPRDRVRRTVFERRFRQLVSKHSATPRAFVIVRRTA